MDEGSEVSRFRTAYRPERHYMRGPGPKWHAKHTAALVAAASVQPVMTSGTLTARAAFLPPMAAWIAPTAAAAALGFVVVMVLA